MGFKFLYILALLWVAVVGREAASTSEEYWKSVMPNTPIPETLKDLIQAVPAWAEEKSTSVNVGHGGVGVYTGKPGRRTNVGVRKGGVTVGTRTKSGKPVYVRVNPGATPFLYGYAATETQLHDTSSGAAIFFTENDLHTGKKLTLQFSKSRNEPPFLPRHIADSIPFSSHKFPQILNTFSLASNSDEANVVKKTINECEDASIKGEEKFCATSLESMIDFSKSKLGKEIEPLSTSAEKREKKVYVIVGIKRMKSEKGVVACHKMDYAYAVFYCHKTESTEVYKVSMAVMDGGSKAEVVAVCHKDTAGWNPKHLAFQVLKVKPGGVPVCHFLPEDHVVWVSS